MLVTIPYGRRHGVLELLTAPAEEPVTLSEARLFLRVDGTAEDTVISRMIEAARESAEAYLRRSLITQSWALWFDEYVSSAVRLPKGPVQSITHVKTHARDGTETVISNSTYYLNAGKERIVFDVAPIGCKVEIAFVAGYGDAAAVPAVIKQGILEQVAVLYDNRGEDATLSDPAMALLHSYRREAL